MKSHIWLVFNILIILIALTSLIECNRKFSEKRKNNKIKEGKAIDNLLNQFAENTDFNKNLIFKYDQGEMIPGFESINTTPGFYGSVINSKENKNLFTIPNYLTEPLRLIRERENDNTSNNKKPGFDNINEIPGFDKTPGSVGYKSLID